MEQFIQWTNGNYKKIYSMEPDIENFNALNELVKIKNYKNIETFNLGAWNKKDILTFESDATRGSYFVDSKIESFDSNDKQTLNMQVDAPDNLISDKYVDIIKMDIEGSELKALEGSVEIIKNSMPALAICAYHKSEDLFTIPQYIKRLNHNYRIYLRKHGLVSSFELLIYAI